MASGISVTEFRALGTGVRILTDRGDALAAARAAVEQVLDAIDRTCSRFRADSELSKVNRSAGAAVSISPLLAQVLAVAIRVADTTLGAVDPTVGAALRRIGYDRDFALVPITTDRLALVVTPAPGWKQIELDERQRWVRIPAGTELDLGSSAKAWAADRAAAAACDAAACGVLLSLGGDIAVAGPPPKGGWSVLVAEDHAAPLDSPGQIISITSGGLATSSTTVRRWTRDGVTLHHIVDPVTGLPAHEYWRTVSVGAASCVDANAAATAAIVMGEPARAWLETRRLPARLVRADGEIVLVAGWPPF